MNGLELERRAAHWECFPSMQEALGSISSTINKQTKQNKFRKNSPNGYRSCK